MQSKLTETRQSWTYQEDKLLLELIKLYGCTSWNRIAHELQSQAQDSLKIRSPAACRERYQNILNPNLNKSHWTEEEEQQLFNLQQTFGNSWARIASLMPGRSDLLCKNYFYATLRKVLRRLSKSVGLDQSSDLLKQIKPSVLGGIYCNDDSYKNFVISEEVKTDFQKLIAKYRHTEKSQLRLLTDNEISYIKTMLNLLFSINNDYIDSKKSKKIIRKESQENEKVKTSTKKESKLESKLSIKFDNSDDNQQQHLTPQIQLNQSEVQPKANVRRHLSQLSIQSPQQIMAFQIQPNLNIWPFQSMHPYQPIQYIPYAQPYPQFAYSYAYMM